MSPGALAASRLLDPPVGAGTEPYEASPSPGSSGHSLAATVVHSTPGRVRFRVQALRRQPVRAEFVARAALTQAGVDAARANAACGSLVLEFDPHQTSVPKLRGWLLRGAPDASHGARRRKLDARASTTPTRVPLLGGVAALALGLLGAPAILTTGLLLVGAAPILARALSAASDERRLSADALDATAVAVLIARGSLPAAALSVALIAGGEYIRDLTARQSRMALSSLLSNTSEFAWVQHGRRKEKVPVAEVQPGDTVVVYPGELIPVDGVVLRGRAIVDTTALTGESEPAPVGAGAAVYASTVLTDGKLYLLAEKVGDATRASRIVRLLDDAPMHDTRLANYARRYADRLVLPTFGLAGFLLLVTGDVARCISVLIIDFATGIRVSAPTTVLAAMTAAVRRDVLVKGGRALEELALVDTLVFDKTGTLTVGKPQVRLVQALRPDISEWSVLSIAAAAERRLTHPAARAIVRAAEAQDLPIPERGESEYVVGEGVRVELNGDEVLVGSPAFLRRRRVQLPAHARSLADQIGTRGISSVFVARNGVVIGIVGYADEPRVETPAVLDRIRALGIRELIMVTGDNRRVAHAVAARLGIEQVRAEVLPDEKAVIVRNLQAQGRKVAVVGDGINDSPALAYANVSIGLDAGSDVARETADIVLHGDLHGLPEAIQVARQSMTLIRQNLAIVGVPNAAGMLLAGFGALGPVAATALNNGSSVAAALNGLRPLMNGDAQPSGNA
ncbi:MAG: heavy metal translocating P-type ATPase [Chloroflexi bacterium]|nr:heavy metal translocating P-type ATPase [Chloroflexota bacterium]